VVNHLKLRLQRGVRRLAREESGVTLIFVTLSLVVLIGLVAFAVDTAALYQERRELQNGADAAAIAIAEDCALGAKPCTQVVAETTADTFADANAGDSAAAVDGVALDVAAQTVTVDVSTEDPGGGTIFRPFFARVLGFNGTTVNASAGAAWGFPAGLETFPLIISECEWERETNYGANLHSDSVLPPPGTPTLLKFHTGNAGTAHDDCAAQAGQDADGDGRMPGGFGWLDTGGGDCLADTDEGLWVDSDPGSSPSNGCSASEVKDTILNKIVFIPWFDDLQGNGANGEFHVAGFGALYVTGYNFGGQFKEPQGGVPCSGQIRCLEGYFLETTLTHGDDLGGTDHGVIVVKFTD
jgi:Flp pilus assembly protein TadG